MPTQTAPTPIVRGDAARVIYEETQRRPTQASERGARILADRFGKSGLQNWTLDNYDKTPRILQIRGGTPIIGG